MNAGNVSVLSFNIHYCEEGSGPPVILLHGLGGDGSRWGPNIRPLAADFRVIVPDQIGFGQSDKPLVNYHTGMLAEFLARFMKAIELPKASIVGSSMGAWVGDLFRGPLFTLTRSSCPRRWGKLRIELQFNGC